MPTAIEDREMMMPGTSGISIVLGRCDDHPMRHGSEPIIPNNLVLIRLRSAEEWDKVAAFVVLTMCDGVSAGVAK